MPEGATIESLSGRVLEGRFRLDAPLGEGGLGVVWRGYHVRLGKPVAIKLMQREHLVREGLRQRFEREARSLAALSHPNIVDVIDFGVDEDLPYLVMELLEGRSLDRAIESGLHPDRALAIARDVARALAHAHAIGIVHRDLKPANVFLQRLSDGSEVVRVLDFGLAKFLADREGEPQLTRQGMVLGTPAYMAPEQAMGGSADARADVYAFGIVLFEMLTGRRPFAGDGGELVRQHLLVAMPTIASMRPDLIVAPEVDALLAKATAKSPAERFASAREIMEALVALPHPAFAGRDGAAMPAISPDAAATRGPRRGAPEAATSAGTSAPSGLATSAPGRDRASAPGAAATSGGAATSAPSAEATVREQPLLPHEHPIPRTNEGPSPVRSRSASGAVSAAPSSVRGGGLGLGAIVGMGAAALVVLGVAAAIVVAWTMGDDPPPTTPVPTATGTEPAPPDPPEPTPPPDTEPDVDPWQAEGVPPLLARLYDEVADGHELSSGEIQALRRYANQHGEDPRPCLVLGHADVERGARTDAVGDYQRALQRDEHATRGDPLTLPHLLDLVAYDHETSMRAEELIANAWGTRALARVEQELRFDHDEGERARLERLRARLVAGSTGPRTPR